MDHPTNGALQVSVTDNSSGLALTLTGLSVGMAELADAGAEHDLRNILHRALENGSAGAGRNPGKGAGS